MDSILQAQLSRVETALNALTESITAYNPSLSAAAELLRADEDLSRGIDELTTHQANHARILALKSTSSALDTTFTNALTTLSTLRSEILSTSVTNPQTLHRQVPALELLQYGRNVSRYAPPAGFKPPSAATDLVTSPAGDQVNGLEPGQGLQQKSLQVGLSFLTGEERAWLDPSTQTQWLPWPSAEMMARSALGQSQGWVGSVPVEVANEQEETGEVEDVDMIMDTGMVERARRESVVKQPGPREEKPKVFTGLDLYDPDED